MRINFFRTELVKEHGVNYNVETLQTCDDVVKMLCDLFHMDILPTEHCYLICLSAKGRAVGISLLSKGDLTSSIVHPRSVFQQAILSNCYGLILAHNHPSGDSTPSREDIEISSRLEKAGELLGIKFLDSIVIGDGNFTSLRKDGLL